MNDIEIERRGRTQVLPRLKSGRPETGAMQFGSDWPGIFIRGDNACYFGMALSQLLAGRLPEINRGSLSQLAELLSSADVAIADKDATNVMIGGVTYVPRAEVPPIDDRRLAVALQGLTAQLYLHGYNPRCWEALNALSPELAELASRDPGAAFDRVRDSDDPEIAKTRS